MYLEPRSTQLVAIIISTLEIKIRGSENICGLPKATCLVTRTGIINQVLWVPNLPHIFLYLNVLLGGLGSSILF